MRYETIKSVLLVFLVITSGVLTWNLWIFQPTYEFNDKKHVHEVSISDPKDIGDVIRPVKLLLHMNSNHYGIVDEKKVDETLQELSGWTFYDLGEERIFSRDQIKGLAQNEKTLELIFPDLVPFDLYKGILRLEAEKLPQGSFDRLFILWEDREHEDGTAYFLDSKEGKVYESHVNSDHLKALFNRLKNQESQFDKFEPYELPDGRLKYLPAKETIMFKYKYYADYIEPEKFRDALFKDPLLVRNDNGEKFKDSTSRMDVDESTNTIFYVNPSQAADAKTNQVDPDLLKKSIEFINEHAGWTDNYKYFSIDPSTQKTTFQLFLKGYPVFNREGMSEIKLYWGKEEVYQYRRPYFGLDVPLPHPAKINMPSGEEVMDTLLADPNIDITKLQELILGYRIYKDPETNKVIVLEPSWFYLYDGSWERYVMEDVRGNLRGLG
ncbi:YycH family regulatory protein [Siminovitchia acidinfaciens]|uniref:YycH family regulatory protein n=1 Tax=Siminovitchia acidinfaciens TaxID=2321395 RepID=UPI0013E046DA|nr:two-component system activity regulator YycH [Siminovitchia acidinfaciens]